MQLSSTVIRTAAILQSSYIPWKGYFDILNSVDEFVLYDDVQYSKNDWRNRNRIKTKNGEIWLSIPVLTKGRFGQNICDVKIMDPRWASKHWKTLEANYAKALFFQDLLPAINNLYMEAENESNLSRVNEIFIRGISKLIGINTRITSSLEYQLPEDRNERLVELCSQLGVNGYLSGPSAKAYLDEQLFQDKGIQLEWMDYSGYPEYEQLYCPPFVHEVSILDLLFNVGPDNTLSYLKKDEV